MALPNVSVGDPHADAHNAERAAINALQTFQAAIAETIDDRVAALLVNGAGITITYDDASNTLTVAASINNEAIDDRVAALLVEGTGIDLTYNDGAGTLSIASTVTPGVPSNPTGIAGATAATNIVIIPQSDYDDLVTKSPTTIYVVT